MAKTTIQVNLQFNANVENAKKQMQSLQNQLNSVINNASGNGKLGMTTQIQEATRSAMDLKIALNNAVNVNTGKLNLNKFQSELQRSGKTISEYAQQLRLLGPEGVKAFNQIASAVASADTKLFNLSGSLKKFSDTMFNTLRWSVASSAIQGVTSAISGTISYARELDTSLNNIRIVTGKSNEEMAKFAETANKMAKTLSSTTKKYSDASLIYFQQGLADKEVKERTDVTVKLANVTRESAEQVSEWMTAIWNNFDDGSEKLEYYADVLAELGAATASSADEIAGGLEKFAAVADTIGLSYEYAASMLATITAETRQSEDVVGTALKTILSRMEQLNQGKTLDDGTTLGKYSQALLNVGVNIKDVNGELKDMDLILQQTGNKWGTLARDQQIALAQSVAGIRQYTQFMALMDNWDVMEKNLAMTENANGALQKQQEIYEDSVEAAEARMAASMENIKSTLLDGDDLKGLYDFASDFLDIVGGLVKGLGGLPTILAMIGTALLKIYQPQVASFVSQATVGLGKMKVEAHNLGQVLKHPVNKDARNMQKAPNYKQQVLDAAKENFSATDSTVFGEKESAALDKRFKLEQQMLNNSKRMSEFDKQAYQWQMQLYDKEVEELSVLERQTAEKKKQAEDATINVAAYDVHTSDSDMKNYYNRATAIGKADYQIDKITDQLVGGADLETIKNGPLKSLMTELGTLGELGATEFQSLGLEGINTLDELRQKIGEIKTALNEALQVPSDFRNVEAKSMNNTAMGIEELEAMNGKGNIDDINNALNKINTDDVANTVEGSQGKKKAGQIKEWKEEAKAIKEQQEALDKSNKSETERAKIQTEIDEKTKKLNKTIKANVNGQKNSNSVLSKAGKQMKKNSEELDETGKAIKDYGEKTRDVSKAEAELNEENKKVVEHAEGIGKGIDKASLGTQHWSDTLAQSLSSVAQLGMGIQMLTSGFTSLGEAIASGEAGWQDYLGAMTSILMSMPMIISSSMQLGEQIGKITQARKASKAAIDAETLSENKGIIAKIKSIFQSKKKQQENYKEATSDLGNAAGDVAENVADGNYPQAASGAAAIIAVGAMIGLGAVSMIGGLVGGSKSEEEQAIADEEAAKGRLDEANQAYDNVKSSLNEYKDSQKAIDELTVGTQEWVEALQSANQQVIELLSQYPELNQFVTTAENGRMTISDEGWTWLTNQKQKQVSMASILAQGTSVRRQRVSLDTDQEEYALEFGGVGSVDGFNVEDPNGEYVDDEQWIRDKIDTLTTEYLEKGEEAFLGLDKELEGLGDKSGEVAEKIRQLVRQEQQLAAAEENLLQQRVNNVLTDGLGYNSHILTQGVQKHVKDYVKNDTKYQKFDQVDLDNLDWGAGEASTIKEFQAGQADIDDIVDKKLENPYVQGAWFGLDMDATDYGLEVLQDYFKDMGIDADINNTDFHKNNISYTTKDGTETTVSYEELLEYEKQKYLESRASELQAMAQKIYATGKKLKASADNVDQAMGEYLESGDLAAIDADVLTNLKNMSEEELRNKLNEYAGTLEDLEMSTEEYVDSIIEQIEGLTKEEVIANRLQREELAYKNTLEQGANGLGMDKNALDAYAQSLMKANSELAENKSQAAQVAVEHYKLGKGLNEVRKALEENIDTLKAANKNSLEYAEALGAIKTAIDKAFGSDVSFEFIEKEMGNIQNMLDGSIEAYDKVRRALVKDWIQNLELDETQIKQIDTLFDRLMKKADEGATEIEISVNDQPAIDSINNLVQKGLIAEKELAAAFRNANLEWGEDTTFTTYTLPSQTKSYSAVKDPKTGEEIYSIETTNESSQTLPWIGDNPPQFKSFTDSNSFADAVVVKNLDGTVKEENKWYAQDSAGNYTVEVTEDNFDDFKYQVLQKSTKDKNGNYVMSGKNSENWSINTQKTYVGSSALTYDGKANESAADRKKRLNDLDKEIERYHEIDEVIQDLDRDLNKISKAKERAFGANKLALIDKEIAKQKELAKADEERLKQAEKWYEVDRKDLLSNYAVKLDQDGRITNYEELIQQQVNKLKGMPETDQGYEDQKEYLDQMKEDFAQYEETLDEVNTQQQAVIDRQYELQDLAMEKIEYKIQIKVDAADDDLALIEFLKQKTEDNDFAAAENINITAQETAATKQKIDAENKGITKIQKELAAGKLSPEQAIEKLREHRDELIRLNADLIEQRNSIYENLNAQFEAFNEEFDKLTNKMDSFGSTLEHYVNIVELAGKDNLGITNDILKELSQAQVNNSKNALAVAESKLKANQDTLALLIKQRDNAIKTYGKDSEQVKKINEQIEAVEEAVQEGMEGVQEAEAAALEAVNKNFETQVNLIVETFEEAISGMYKNLEELEQAFDRQKEISDRYLENYEKTYEISKLNRQINQSLDKTDNVKSQKELRELQSQLLAMNEAGVEVSQRDIEYMQKKYELMLAQQALEDAQNAKSVVRLKRDSEGNYGYVYTADQNTIDNAQQNYEDKLYAMQKYGEESILEIQEQLLAVNREFAEAMAELQANSNLSDEEKKRKQEELLAYYTGKMRYWTEEANKQMQYGSEINLKYNTEMATTFHDTLIGQMYPDLQSFDEFYIQSQGAMSTASENFKLAVNGHYGDIQKISGKTKGKIKGDLDIVQQESDDTVTKAEELGNSMVSEMGKAASAVEEFELAYGDYMENVRDETENTINKIGDLIGKYEDLIATKKEAAQDYSGQGKGGAIYDNPIGPQSPSNNEVGKVEQMQRWAKDRGANPGTIDNKWGKNTKAAMEKAATEWSGKTITFANADEAWKWFENKDDYKKKSASATGTTYTIKTVDNSRLKGDHVRTQGGGDFSLGNTDYLVSNWFSEFEGGTVKGERVNPNNKDSHYSIWVEKNGNKKHAYVTKATLATMLGISANNLPASFDTGGYTGEWGPEGRMAMLHQKEIVLNASDTENFLTAIEIVRSIANQMNLNNQRLSDYAKTSTTIGNVSGDTLQQEVTIHAEFPNATNHSEIEEAFGNLVNLAAQYTNRKF